MSPVAKAEALRRLASGLAGAWVGAMAAIGFVAAPVLFASLGRVEAGRVAARLFAADAYIGLAIGAALLLLALQRSRADSGPERLRFRAEMTLALLALFCTVAGYFGLQPMIESARLGGGGPSFAVLHGAAAAFFLIKLAAAAALAWRFSAVLSNRLARPAVPTS